MKHIFKSLLTLAGAVLLFGACNNEAEVLTPTISVDKAALPQFDGANPASATVTITAEGAWHAYYPSWLTLEPANGNGTTQVKITATPNVDEWAELNAPRADQVAFWGANDAIAYVSVSQYGESGLDATKFFKKITKLEEFDPAFAYLIIAEDKSGLLACQPCASETDNSKSYAYMFPTAVSADEEGTITMENGSLCFWFEAKDEGYAIRQNKGNYLWQDAGYANFYTASTIDKASVWTIEFDEDGNAVMTNKSAGNRIMQYDYKNYKDFGAWQTVEEGYQLVTLWKDSALPSDEVLIVPEETTVFANVTTASIPVTSNKTWKVRCHDSWVKSFTASGTGNGAIEVTFPANTGSEARTATFKVIGETTNFDITLTQFKPATCVADILPMIVSTNSKAPSAYEATLDKAVVSYVNGNNAYIEDESGAILLYLNGHGLVAGNTISGRVFGSGYLYNGLPEITALGTEFEKGETELLPLTTMTLKDLLAAHAANLSRRILVRGVKVTDGIDGNDRDGKIEQDGSSIALRAQLKTSLLTAGSEGDLIAFPTVNNGTKQLAFWGEDMFLPDVTGAVVKVKDLTVEVGKTVAAGATTNSTAPISYTVANDGIVSVDADGTIHGLKVGETTVLVSVPAVEGYTAAEASFKVTVTEPAPATEVTLVLKPEDFPTSYPSAESDLEVSGIKFRINKMGNYGSGIQLQKINGYIYNVTDLGTIKSISIKCWSGKTWYPTNFKFYAGTAANPSTEVEGAAGTDNLVWTFTGDSAVGFFKLHDVTGGAGYLDNITIVYVPVQ